MSVNGPNVAMLCSPSATTDENRVWPTRFAAVVALGTVPRVDSLMSVPFSESFLTCFDLTAFFLIAFEVTAALAMSFFLTLFLPGRATAEPASAATSAMIATNNAGEGRRDELSIQLSFC
jgi:hypothetical protein